MQFYDPYSLANEYRYKNLEVGDCLDIEFGFCKNRDW